MKSSTFAAEPVLCVGKGKVPSEDSDSAWGISVLPSPTPIAYLWLD
jgi:hypothetical protein